MEGASELLLVLHEVPQPGIAERAALLFWKQRNRQWVDASGRQGLVGVQELLDRFERTIDSHEKVIGEADTAVEIFAILRHASPLARTSRNLKTALQQCLEMEPEDHTVRGLSDRAREIERAAELLYADSQMVWEFWRAKRSENLLGMFHRLSKIAFRLCLLEGIFLPVVALGGLTAMNVHPSGWVKAAFWALFFLGLAPGGLLLWVTWRDKSGKCGEGQGKASRRD